MKKIFVDAMACDAYEIPTPNASLLAIRAGSGMLACGYLKIETAEKLVPGISDADYPLLRPEDLIISDYIRIGGGRKSTFRSLVIGSVLNLFRRKGAARPRPAFDTEKCRACSRCVEICPAKALHIENGHAVFEKSRCIRCYCCHEVCPFDAIRV